MDWQDSFLSLNLDHEIEIKEFTEIEEKMKKLKMSSVSQNGGFSYARGTRVMFSRLDK